MAKGSTVEDYLVASEKRLPTTNGGWKEGHWRRCPMK
ncbi:hypothetical protein LINPERPRIM_LOCUS15728, partial [Linum perenne]